MTFSGFVIDIVELAVDLDPGRVLPCLPQLYSWFPLNLPASSGGGGRFS